MPLSRCIYLGGLALLTGCGSTGAQSVTADTGVDAAGEVGAEVAAEVLLPEVGSDSGLDTGLDLAWDAPADAAADADPDTAVQPACEPGQGCFLDKCTQNSQCQSGWCVDDKGEGVCSVTCQDECPAGWTCQQVAGSAPDVVFICVSGFANLCRPCLTDADCKSVGGVDDVCVDYGPDGDFCGGPCAKDGECPWGFSCKDVTTVAGAAVKQCVADTGSCPCTTKSTALAATTACEVGNGFGSCSGKRVCTADGLTACDAETPGAEECNGLDDDCDGDVDEPDLVEGKLVELCDDGNGCTQDSCKGADGCAHLPLNGDECIDGDPCTVADHCDVGACFGTPVVCKDDNPCTDDSCDGAGGCLFANNDDACDDGDPCTVGDQCGNGECAGQEVDCDCQTDLDCAALEDADACNGTLLCNLAAFPFTCVVDPATVVECPPPAEGPDAPCQAAACVPETGECTVEPANGGFLCDDGDACTIGDTCGAAACNPGVPANCADDNPCTDDSCDPLAGCVHEPNDAPCSDGNVCTTADTCAGGVCVAGAEDSCEDWNPCTQDSCDPAAGCVHKAADAACDDGNACTTGDHCQSGWCKATGLVECEDGNPCTTATCDPAVGCVQSLNTAPCDDGDTCTFGDHCALGACIASGKLTCDDGNVCTDDACAPAAGCQFVPNAAACDDSDACTANDTCSGGWCTGKPVACVDGNPCTADSCDPKTGCAFTVVPDGQPCGGPDNWACVKGQCQCAPACGEKTCGDDGCGGSCGQCGPGTACSDGSCIQLVTKCGGIVCPDLPGYDVTCNPTDHCEYTNQDASGWKQWDVWIWIPPGTLTMGSPANEAGHSAGEEPVHPVTFSAGYFIAKYEAVVSQYEACNAANAAKCTTPSSADWPGTQGTNTSALGKADHPQNGLTVAQAKSFCGWLAPDGRLPSEAEWEYAAKGPVHRKYPWGDAPGATCLNGTAVFNELTTVPGYGCGQGGTLQVGAKGAGASWCGAMDMGGNVWERCEDIYHPNYVGAPDDGLAWVDGGTYPVVRGGAFSEGAGFLRSAARGWAVSTVRRADVGVRCVRPLPGCVPNCAGKQCGNDGCGGSCGQCAPGAWCEAGTCKAEVTVLYDGFDNNSVDVANFDASGIKWGSMGGYSVTESGTTLKLNASVGTTGNTYGGTAWARALLNLKTGSNYRIRFKWSYVHQSTSLNYSVVELAQGPISVSTGGLFDHNIYEETAGRRLLYRDNKDVPQATWSVCVTGTTSSASLYTNADCSGAALKTVTLADLSAWYFRVLACTATSGGFPANNVTIELDDLEITKL